MRTFSAMSGQIDLEIISPATGSTSDISPVFTWRVDGMDEGEFRVFLGESQLQMPLLGTTTDNSLRYQGQLENDKTYYWRVELWRDGRLLSSTAASQFMTAPSETTTSVEDSDLTVLYFGGALNIVSLGGLGLEIVEIPYQYDGGVPAILNGKILYVIDETGRLSAIDFSSGRAEVVGTLITDTTPEKMFFEGGYLWILDTKSAGAVIRVSLNSNGIPERMDSIYRDWTTPVDLFVTKDLSRIYLADALSGIKILEREGTRYLDRTSSFSVPLEGYSRAVAEKDGVVFSGEAGMDGGLKLIDTEKSLRSNVGRYYIVLRIEISENILYASTDKGVAIVDVSDPSSPVVLRDLELTQVDEISVSGSLLVVKSGSRMLIYDVERPNDPVLLESRNE